MKISIRPKTAGVTYQMVIWIFTLIVLAFLLFWLFHNKLQIDDKINYIFR